MSDTSITITVESPTGTRARRTFEADGRLVVKVGRDVKAHLCLPDGSVSRMHAVFEVLRGEARVIDLGSGTKVNGAPVNAAVVVAGDVVEVGAVRLTVEAVGGGEVATPAAPPAARAGASAAPPVAAPPSLRS